MDLTNFPHKEEIDNTKTYIEINEPDPQVRAIIHEYCNSNGIKCRTKYEAIAYSMVCRNCGKETVKPETSSDYEYFLQFGEDAPKVFSAMPGDSSWFCNHCHESNYFSNDYEDFWWYVEEGDFKVKWISTGQMIVAKSGFNFPRYNNALESYRKKYKTKRPIT